LKEVSNAGASGSLFYISPDDNFIMKTVQSKEASFLRKLLPGYFLVCMRTDGATYTLHYAVPYLHMWLLIAPFLSRAVLRVVCPPPPSASGAKTAGRSRFLSRIAWSLQNLTQNTKTLLPKFFGLYCYQSLLGRHIRLVIMNNVLPTHVSYHEKYDLKVYIHERV
jgi:hypothetical protein